MCPVIPDRDPDFHTICFPPAGDQFSSHVFFTICDSHLFMLRRVRNFNEKGVVLVVEKQPGKSFFFDAMIKFGICNVRNTAHRRLWNESQTLTYKFIIPE